MPRIDPITADACDENTIETLTALGNGSIDTAFNIFKTLAHHPKLMRRWSAFGGVLLYAGDLPVREREILILRTGWNCRSEYEWGCQLLRSEWSLNVGGVL